MRMVIEFYNPERTEIPDNIISLATLYAAL